MPKAAENMYQLKVTLDGSKPPIWRRLLVPSTISLPDLHDVLQISMGWTNSHLHQFFYNGEYYGMIEGPFGEPLDMDVEDENQYTLNQLLNSEKQWLRYDYDFGDNWTHRVLLEKIVPIKEGENQTPACIKGKGACPLEDCGGIWGYYNLLEALKNPEHPEHENMKEWVDFELDPEEFDLEDINEELASFFG